MSFLLSVLPRFFLTLGEGSFADGCQYSVVLWSVNPPAEDIAVTPLQRVLA